MQEKLSISDDLGSRSSPVVQKKKGGPKRATSIVARVAMARGALRVALRNSFFFLKKLSVSCEVREILWCSEWVQTRFITHLQPETPLWGKQKNTFKLVYEGILGLSMKGVKSAP